MMDIPKTLIIGINMHGELILNGILRLASPDSNQVTCDLRLSHLVVSNEPIYGTVPENLTVYTINSVAPGVPNISTLKNYENLSEQINEKVQTIEDLDTVNAEDLTEELKDLLVELNKDQSQEIIKLAQQNYSKGIKNEHQANYAHHYNKSFQINTYYSNENIPNKLFLKFTESEISKIDQDGIEDGIENRIEDGYFNKIVLYNLAGQHDLFKLLEVVSDIKLDRINISQMCDFFTSLGIENLIIVDLSCSIFRGEKQLSQREIRYARQQYSKFRAGKKTRKYRTMSKNRISKKKRKPKNNTNRKIIT